MIQLSWAGGARFAMRVGFPLGILALCLSLMTDRLAEMSIAQITAQMAHVSANQWTAALALTAVSLWAAGRYDVIAHRHLQTGISRSHAARSGTIAICLAQTLGFGIFTGALARWRMLPDLSFARAMALSAFVTLSFMIGLLVVGAAVMLIFSAPGWTLFPALAVMAGLPFLAYLFFTVKLPKVFGKSLRFPSLRASGAILLWTLVDVSAAAAALFVLMPDAISFGVAVFFPAYLLALAAALLSGTPGGVGPFELTLLSILPQAASTDVLCAIVMFRVIYYAVPALLAMLAMTRPFGSGGRDETDLSAPDFSSFKRAECGLIRQNGGFWHVTQNAALAIWPTRQTHTALCDPITNDPARALVEHAREATAYNKIAVLYKCTSRIALCARNLGWAVLHIADEAVLTPSEFDLDRPSCRSLRRKLRSATKAGIVVRAPHVMPWEEMARIDREWQVARGPARGGTMGRFCPDYLSRQYVVLAWQGDQLLAYASFHTSDHQWCLDLMRCQPDAPDGTMHTLVNQAITAARARNIAQISLAATPACPDPENAFFRRLARWVVSKSGGPGLRQFKSSFGPVWVPLYMASPTAAGLTLAAADIAYSVTHPETLIPSNGSHPHNQDENYEFVLSVHS
ncbi:phosphatidylglycerol lysyltransferase domain-containing protein [Roseobacter sp. EG26]|uniref:phosphatidylglycerol lysyltransferase domain-containing protein n=1 Tax=Roseobacter sp. EG26 TaxID=3412477 RepID=UPI003CE456B9